MIMNKEEFKTKFNELRDKQSIICIYINNSPYYSAYIICDDFQFLSANDDKNKGIVLFTKDSMIACINIDDIIRIY